MRAAIYHGPRSIEVGERPDPVIAAPTDTIVRVVLACVCGSDLWYYRGDSPHALGPIGHEFLGIVEDVGAEVTGIAKGDLVISPFVFGDGTCPHCLAGWPTSCVSGGSFGNHGIDGGQGEAVRVPFAGATLVKVPGVDAALECVGTGQSMATAFSIARPGSIVGAVGAPHGVEVPIETVIFRNVGLRGGVSPARRYIPELLPDVLEGRIDPGAVLDYETDLDGIPDAYVAMDERRAIKSLVRVGSF